MTESFRFTCPWEPTLAFNSEKIQAEYRAAQASGWTSSAPYPFYAWLEAAYPNPNRPQAAAAKPVRTIDVAAIYRRRNASAAKASWAESSTEPARVIDAAAIYDKRNGREARINGTDADADQDDAESAASKSA